MDYAFESRFNKEYGLVMRKIVRILSYNSRATVSEIAKELKMSRSTVAKKLKKMESSLKVEYTIEFDPYKLRLLNPHVVLVRFHKKPDYLDVARTLGESYVTQFAATVKGTYDMLIYANAYAPIDYLTWDMRMRALLMKKYKMEWHTSTVGYHRMGYIPVRDETLAKATMPPRYKDMIRLLNLNSRISLTQLSKRLGLNYKTTVYTFNSLMKLGYIRRFTITLGVYDKISIMTMMEKFIPTLNYEGVEAISKKFFTIDDRLPLVNRVVLSSNSFGAYDFFMLGAYDDFETGYEHAVKFYNKVYKDYDISETEYGEVKDVLVGRLPLRSVDAAKEFRHFHVPELLGRI